MTYFSIKRMCMSYYLQKHDQGQVLLDIVFKHLDLTERDYFGLQLADESTDNPVSQINFINHDINLMYVGIMFHCLQDNCKILICFF